MHKSYKTKLGRKFWELFDQLPKQLRDELNYQSKSPNMDDLAAAIELAGPDLYEGIPNKTLKAIGLDKLVEHKPKHPKGRIEKKRAYEQRLARSRAKWMTVYEKVPQKRDLDDPTVRRLLGEEEIARLLALRNDASKVRPIKYDYVPIKRILLTDEPGKDDAVIEDYFERAERTTITKAYHNAGNLNGDKG